MRRLLLLFAFAAFRLGSFSQPPQASSLLRDSLLQKSGRQKKAGFILLAGGAALSLTWFALPRGKLVYDGICVSVFCDDRYQNDNLKTGLLLTGIATAVGGVFFQNAAARNKRKADALARQPLLRMEEGPPLWGGLPQSAFPAVGVRLAW